MLHDQAMDTDFSDMVTVDAEIDDAIEAVAFIAAPRERPIWMYNSEPASTLTVTGTTGRAYLDRIQLWNDTNAADDEPSLRCADAHVDIRRSHVVNNDGGGIEALGQCEIVIHNSFVGTNDVSVDALLIVDSTVAATILYSTLGGADGAAAALRCPSAGPNVHVRNSLLVSRSGGPEVDCDGAILTTNATEAGLMVDMDTNWFNNYDDGDFHLTNDAPDGIIIADWLPGDPTTDIDGNPRIIAEGQLGRAGADVP